jgi:hypothetical protein
MCDWDACASQETKKQRDENRIQGIVPSTVELRFISYKTVILASLSTYRLIGPLTDALLRLCRSPILA